MTRTCALPKSKFPLKFKVESPVHALQLARQLIRPFGNWTTGAFARNKRNSEVSSKSSRAEAFCALGALYRVNTKHAAAAKDFLTQAAGELCDDQYNDAGDIFTVNDSERSRSVHRDVLKMFTRAIELAKEAGR